MWLFRPHIGPTRQGRLGQCLASWSLDSDGYVRVSIRIEANRNGHLYGRRRTPMLSEGSVLLLPNVVPRVSASTYADHGPACP